MHIQIAVQDLMRPFGQLQCFGHVGYAQAADSAWSSCTADQKRCKEDMKLIDGCGIEKRSQEITTTFDQYVGEMPPAQFHQQRVHMNSAMMVRQDQHFTPVVL